MSLRDSMVSMALSEKRCCLPLFLVVSGFQDLMIDGDIHRVKEPLLQSDCSYSFQLVTLYFFLYFGLRLLLCSSFIISSISIENIIHQIYLCTKAKIRPTYSINIHVSTLLLFRQFQKSKALGVSLLPFGGSAVV